MTNPQPPMVSGGLPVLGHMIEMLKNRDGLFRRGHAEQGDLFAMKLGPQKVVVVTGAEYNKQMYMQTDKGLNMQDGYTFLKEAIGEVLFTASPEAYYNQRPALQEVFRRERMVGYIRAMNIEIQRWLDGLGESGEIDMTQEMLNLTQAVAGHGLIGPNFREELGDNFWELYGAISESLDPVLPPTLPLPKFKRRDRARAKIGQVLSGLIEKRRRNPDDYDDLISDLLTTPLKDGSIMPNETIISMFTGLIFAGHETTAGQAAWLVALLLEHPDYLSKVKAKIAETVVYGGDIDAKLLSNLNHIYWAIKVTSGHGANHPSEVRVRYRRKPLTQLADATTIREAAAAGCPHIRQHLAGEATD